MKTSIYTTIEEDRLYKSIAQLYNMSYSSPVPPIPSFLSTKKLKEEEQYYMKLNDTGDKQKKRKKSNS